MSKRVVKALAIESKRTRQALELDEKQSQAFRQPKTFKDRYVDEGSEDEQKKPPSRENDAPGGFTADGYRKHPYHKPSWGPYPTIYIAKSGASSTQEKKLKKVKQALNKKPTGSAVAQGQGQPPDVERSAGNISVRNVIEKLQKKGKGNNQSQSIYFRTTVISLPWVIMMIARFSLIWEIVMYFSIIATFFLASFSAFFTFYEERIWGAIDFLNIIFAADTAVRLLVEIWRCKTSATVVVFTSPYTMFQFCLDLLSMIPMHLIYYWIEGPNELTDLSRIDFFRFNKFIRLSRCIKFFETLKRQRMVNEKFLFLFKFTNYYIAFIHFTACLLISGIRATPLDFLLFSSVQNKLFYSYLENFHLNKLGYGHEPWDIYVLTTTFATAVITTVGYGDIIPNNELEMAICIVCMLFGAIFLNGHFTGEITNFESEQDGARFDLFYRVREIKNFLTSINTRPFLNAKVMEYYDCLWTYREGVFDVSFMRAIPQTFHEELLFDLCQEMFDKSHLFNNLDPSFLRALSKISNIALYNANMILCQKGSLANKLFYILQGECQAMSKLNPSHAAAVFRAGSIIGEANLLFSFPYSAAVETRTCCQFIIMTKKDLFEVMDQFPLEFEVVRSRSLMKIKELYDTHQYYGVDPVCWVKAKTDMVNPSKPSAEKLRRNMRWGHGLNQEVLEDLVDDSHDTIIFDTPVLDPSVQKNHLIPYVSCAVPEIMHTEIKWFRLFNYFIISLALWFAFFGPYCLVFGESSKIEYYTCRVQYYLNQGISLVFIVDVFVEILGACPVAGWRYKFIDGLKVVRHQPTFYLDILSALPLDIGAEEDQSFRVMLGTVFKVLKLWKVIRVLHYLDNVYPLQLFWFRLAQTIIVLLYGIHFIACISYTLACPFDKGSDQIVCNKNSWIGSYEASALMDTNNDEEEIPDSIKSTTIGYDSPYLHAFFYSTATLTSAGFGDFNPQNRREMLSAIGFMLFGFYLIGYYTSVLTSALSCLVRPKLALQQQLVSLYQFMNHYQLRERLKDRIIEYFVLQHQFRGGVPLDQTTHIMYDAPAYLRNDVLYLEVFELLDGVPVFSKLEAEIIIKLAGVLQRFCIPPHTTFVVKGEVRRILYIIKHGSMGVYEDENENSKPVSILEATTHFGLRDLLFGEPYHRTIRSLSYVSLYGIKRKDFEECLQYEEEFWDLVNDEKGKIKEIIHEMTTVYANITPLVSFDDDKATNIPSWVEVPQRIPPKAQGVLGQVQQKLIDRVSLVNDEYEGMFQGFRAVSFLKFFLLRRTIHPVGHFSKLWNCVMSFVSCFTVITLMLETFCYLRMPTFRLFQIILDCFNYIDIYLKFHWSYYNPHNGMLITHPLQTAMNYIQNGSFVQDIVICAPVELLMWMSKLTNFLGYGKAATWYSRLRWIRFFQFKRIVTVFHIAHNISENRNTILLFLYVFTTLVVCTIVSSVAQFIACPWEPNDWDEGDQYRIPICLKTGWVAKKFANADTNPAVISGVFRRWILGLYYVSQVILVIGFGDMITLNKADLILLIFMCVFGFLFMRCVIADMTAAEVDSDEARAEFVENIKVLDLIMKREKIPKMLANTVMSHLQYTWMRSRGLQPRQLFGALHPVLESELYKNLVGDRLRKVPIFRSLPAGVLRSMCRYMKTQYILRGERIMRYGNLEYQMCIIIAGKVFITDRHLNYICSLGPGQSFGECAVIYGLQRRYNAVAACNTELYVLTAALYETFLARYPNVRNEMKSNLGYEKRDYFESVLDKKLAKALKLSTRLKQQMMHNFEQRTAMVKNLIMLKEDPEHSGLDLKEAKQYSKSNRFFDYGDLDDNLPLFYLAVPQQTRTKKSFVWPAIHPNCGLMKQIVSMMSWLCFITPGIASYEVCFSKEFLSSSDSDPATKSFIVSKYLHQVSEFIEVTFLLQIFINFFLAYEIKPGVYNKSTSRIALRYVTALDGFFFDLIACAPFILEKFNIDNNEFKTMVGKAYLLRSMRLYHYFKSQLAKKNDLNVSTFRLQITLSVTTFCLMAHMLSCLFYWISPCRRPDLHNNTFKFETLCPPPDDDLDNNGWTTQFAKDKDIELRKDRLEAWRWWFRSLYWVVTTISTTGFGDIVPTTINEMAVGIICIFCGAFILSIILGQFTSGMASLTKANREYMYQVLLLVKHLKNIGLSEIRQSHIMMYFLTMWNISRGIPYHKAFRQLPITLQTELAYALFGDTLDSVPFFQDAFSDKSFIRQLSTRVTHSLFIPGTYIHKFGDPGSVLFVVYKGIVSGTLKDSVQDIELSSVYIPGDSFGRFAALFHDGVYKKSYRAESMVEILEVKQADILHLARKFPFFKAKINSFINSRYEPRGTHVNIFDRKRRRGLFFGEMFLENMHHDGPETKAKKENKRKRKERKQRQIIREVKSERESKLISERSSAKTPEVHDSISFEQHYHY